MQSWLLIHVVVVVYLNRCALRMGDELQLKCESSIRVQEFSLLKVPYEALNRKWRSGQKVPFYHLFDIYVTYNMLCNRYNIICFMYHICPEWARRSFFKNQNRYRAQGSEWNGFSRSRSAFVPERFSKKHSHSHFVPERFLKKYSRSFFIPERNAFRSGMRIKFISLFLSWFISGSQKMFLLNW